MIYRRFGYIHSRLLMHRQDELRELEDTLSEMDKNDAADPKRQLRLQSREIDEEEEAAPERDRVALLNRIEEKALKYGISFFRIFFNPAARQVDYFMLLHVTSAPSGCEETWSLRFFTLCFDPRSELWQRFIFSISAHIDANIVFCFGILRISFSFRRIARRHEILCSAIM